MFDTTRARRLLGASLLLLLTAAAPAIAQPPHGPAATSTTRGVNVSGETHEWQPGRSYAGIFADPDIAEHNGRWYAYATNTSNLRLPALVSTDLTRWHPLGTVDGDPYEPLPQVGEWVLYPTGGGTLWAPSVAAMGGGWTAAYSAQESWVGGVRHNCIGLARSASPTGPFVPTSRRPLVCGRRSPLGVIDPDLYTDPSGRNWLAWKFSGIARKQSATIMVRQLNATGTGWAHGSRQTTLLRLNPHTWEGDTIENPSLLSLNGVTYLFYSANAYLDARYATGYAICATVTGPCSRPTSKPLLGSIKTSRRGYTGPGGAAAFVHDGTLRLIYHAWDMWQEGVLRRMHIATVEQKANARLVLRHLG